MRLLILTPDDAQAVRGETLAPRLILGGTYAGKYALNPAVLTDDDHVAEHDRLALCPERSVAPEAAWPPEE